MEINDNKQLILLFFLSVFFCGVTFVIYSAFYCTMVRRYRGGLQKIATCLFLQIHIEYGFGEIGGNIYSMSYYEMSDGMTSRMLNQWYVVNDIMFGNIS